jgi:hypothetical protein
MAHATWTDTSGTGRHEVVEPMTMTWPDGTQTIACCGPAALKAMIAGATSYRPTGESQPGRCCHTR